MNRILAFFFFLTFFSLAYGQRKMDESVYATWNKIEHPMISDNGDWICYELVPGYGDPTLVIYNTLSKKEVRFDRASKAKFNKDGDFLAFTISPSMDSLRAMKLREVKKEDLPPDTLGIYHLPLKSISKVSHIKSYSFPEEWNGCIGIIAEIEKMSTQKDTITNNSGSAKKGKRADHLLIRNLISGQQDTLGATDQFVFAKRTPWLVWSISGKDSLVNEGVFALNVFRNERKEIWMQEGKYDHLAISESGKYIAAIADLDTSTARRRKYNLLFWNKELDSTRILVDQDSLIGMDKWKLSNSMRPVFSEDETRLFFGIAPEQILEDSTLLDEERVQVEIWSSSDEDLYTRQENTIKNDLKKSYEVLFDIRMDSLIPLGSDQFPDITVSDERKGRYTMLADDRSYRKYMSWEGRVYNDVYLKDLKTSAVRQIGIAMHEKPKFSPQGNYLYWFDQDSSIWRTYSIKDDKLVKLKLPEGISFADELNDLPATAEEYGIAGWTDGDDKILIYDRFDIWEVDPAAKADPVRLSFGREEQIKFRYIKLDPEERSISDNKLLLYAFDEKDKSSGYAYLQRKDRATQWLRKGPYLFSSKPVKAKNAPDIMFTKEDFSLFPDLIHTNTLFSEEETISFANPQQDHYDWGTIELVKWTTFKGKSMEGMLVKPANFDSTAKYPVIVNFYERSSFNLHKNRAPEAHRSTINYGYYSNRGYIIFNPDVSYEIGHPGESCYDAVISGVEMIKQLPFTDSTKIGVQGHSWGGYQIAYLLTKTDVFKCAEAGAPVVNMTSAYGGIRWGSGLSRMFQYEKTQSRIGATLWERPDLYMENSPIFEMDKVHTPVLILHNDNDGAVPWYQGIEYFVALRRLGKTAWMLNYNDEPHWPLKWHNRLDFNIRMQQFFDFYLQDAPMPMWMENGVPARYKGKLTGLEKKEIGLDKEKE